MNNGNVSGQYVEFQRAVLGKLPRNLSWVELDYLTQHVGELSTHLEGLKDLVPQDFIFEVEMTYGKIEDVMQKHDVVTNDMRIDSDHIMPAICVTNKRKIHIVRISLKEIDTYMARKRLRHANLHELVSAVNIPQIWNSLIVAGGSAMPLTPIEGVYRYMPCTVYSHRFQKMIVFLINVNDLERRSDFYFACVEY